MSRAVGPGERDDAERAEQIIATAVGLGYVGAPTDDDGLWAGVLRGPGGRRVHLELQAHTYVLTVTVDAGHGPWWMTAGAGVPVPIIAELLELARRTIRRR